MLDVLHDERSILDAAWGLCASPLLRRAAADVIGVAANGGSGCHGWDTRMDGARTEPLLAAQLPAPRKPELLPDGGSEAVLERVPQKVEPPPLHQVVLLNDDYTPMEFVVMVLQEFFNKDRDTATQIMLQVHVHGRGVCGIYTADIAATKVDQVLKAASHAGHPLQCISEPVD